MADLSSITGIRLSADSQYERVRAGATIDPGEVVYLDSGDSEYKLALHGGTAAQAAAAGIAITPGTDGELMLIWTGGTAVLVGATVAVGEQYCVSANAGGIAPDADIGSGDYVTQLGVGVSATSIKLNINATGITHA